MRPNSGERALPFERDLTERRKGCIAEAVEKADLVLVTHGHWDYVGDTLTIAEKTNAKVIIMYELGKYPANKGTKNVIEMNRGGNYTSHGIAITMIHADHSSSIFEEDQIIFAGDPAGFVIRFEKSSLSIMQAIPDFSKA